MLADASAIERRGVRTACDWLRRSAERMRLPLPEHCLVALADALPLPIGDHRQASSALVAGGPPIEASFVPDAPALLRIDFEPIAVAATPEARRDAAAASFARLATQAFGYEAGAEAKRHGASLFAPALGAPRRFGAFLGMAIGNHGLHEAKLYAEWREGTPEGVSHAVAAAAEMALATVPGLVRLFTSIACGTDGCAHRLYTLCNGDFAMRSLEPALAAAQLADRLPDAASRLAPFLGPAGLAPRGSAVISFREGMSGVECKVELLTRALEIPESILAARVARMLDAHERVGPAYRDWLAAIGAVPNDVNVVGVRIAPRKTARLGVYVSPHFDSFPR